MTRPPDYMYRISEALSEVMDDIGVNERLVMKRRRASLLHETIMTFAPRNLDKKYVYHFGSSSESSTTLGMGSDIDTLLSFHGYFNVIQALSEWKEGVDNFMMIQNEDISPGYCYLERTKPDQPLPATVNDVTNDILVHCAIDNEGRLLWQNTNCLSRNHGPALTDPGKPWKAPTDLVYSYFGKSLPHQVTSWLHEQRERKWPTEDVLEECKNSGCFVVPVCSKEHSSDSIESKLEWRLSTSLQERYLMFSLNIPQLMCYILMKMILKTYIDPHVEDVLSSFMCKNVLMYCIANSSLDWHTENLLSYLLLCLFMLKECIEQRNCPHLIIPENNLLTGHMTDKQRDKVLDIISNLMENDEQLLFEIQLDDLGRRLKIKLNMIPYCPNIPPASLTSLNNSVESVYRIALTQSGYLQLVLEQIEEESLDIVNQLSLICSRLDEYRNESDFQQAASELLTSLLSSTLGTVMACTYIDNHTAISEQAFTYLEAGKESDALSGRLKLVSVLYCSGDIEKAEHELAIIQTKCIIAEVHTLCGCYSKMAMRRPKLRGIYNFELYNEEAIKSNVAFCTRFLENEINCVPQELRFEVLRSYIGEDEIGREEDFKWMDYIVVDSIPYLFFLEYKTYRHLQRRKEQEEALHNLVLSIELEPQLGHKETALNLLGQCLEQENRHNDAIQCYIKSIKHRKRNNAGKLLLCLHLLNYRSRKTDNGHS